MILGLSNSATWSLLDPWFLALWPLVFLVLCLRLLRPRAALATASSSLLHGLPRSLRSRLLHLPLLLQALALAALVLAVARPVTREVLPLREQGVDIVLVTDISGSMLATDMHESKATSRIQAAKEKALEFAKARVHDRVGLVTFARYPELRCPLTLDQDALAAFLRSVETVDTRSPENATAIGVALAMAVRLLEASEAASRVVVLLSDGDNNVDLIKPVDAAKLAKDAGIVTHTIGLGKGRALGGFFGSQVIPSEFTALKQISETTGGRFFEARGARELGEVYAQIDEMERVELADPRYRSSDWFAYPFTAGVLLLLLSWLLEFGWIRGLP